jgi:predicted RNase H-like HicB family nuclease
MRRMNHASVLTVRIQLRNEGTYFYASSADLPGLHVCGTTEAETRASAALGVKALVAVNLPGSTAAVVWPA